ncbi:hypothetical protein [Bradyrhizobium sp. BR13661]|uniref:hypothetical protein n=1 Tax=Bradyrhizobium sp. BR13661 TaxID=2940622 RepID=UPI002476F0FD|nr:hypothetical protein [Bradyrhizobium sp. BR13661]MDH6263349.1 hypothetical protein [Bradyrhizobium sp. BR13661]
MMAFARAASLSSPGVLLQHRLAIGGGLRFYQEAEKSALRFLEIAFEYGEIEGV